MNCNAEVKRTNSQNCQNTIISIFHISASISYVQTFLLKNRCKVLYCDQTLYITNVCRVINRVTKVALLNNFQNESECGFFTGHCN